MLGTRPAAIPHWDVTCQPESAKILASLSAKSELSWFPILAEIVIVEPVKGSRIDFILSACSGGMVRFVSPLFTVMFWVAFGLSFITPTVAFGESRTVTDFAVDGWSNALLMIATVIVAPAMMNADTMPTDLQLIGFFGHLSLIRKRLPNPATIHDPKRVSCS